MIKNNQGNFKVVRVKKQTPLRNKKNRMVKRKEIKKKSHHKATKANWARRF